MSIETNKGGPALQPVRMDQEFQLQNLRRLALNQDSESTGQYLDAYSTSASSGYKGVSLAQHPEHRFLVTWSF